MEAKRIVAAFACALLCAALYAPAAFAAELAAGSQGKAKLQDQAATKTVYVLVKKTEKSDGSGSVPITYTYSYNKSGLLTKFVEKQARQKLIDKYAYDKSNRLTKISTRFGSIFVNKYSKGKLAQTIEKRDGLIWNTYKATYKSGKVVKKTMTNYFRDNGKTKTNKSTSKFSYNKKGLVSKYNRWDFVTTCKYDAQNNLVQKSEAGSTTKYRNKYSKGNLVKQVRDDGIIKMTSTYKYKKVKVKKAVAEKVKQQQWSLLNEDLNNALDLVD